MGEEYDVVIVGAGIGGAVAAWECASRGLKTLILESKAIPREKSCSGVQFPGFFGWMERKGLPVPDEVLAEPKTLLGAVWVAPSGKRFQVNVPLPNFWRKRFDGWLVEKAREAGAVVQDRCYVREFKEGIPLRLRARHEKNERSVEGQYIIGADGSASVIRHHLLPNLRPEERSWMGVSYQEYWDDWRGEFQDYCHVFLRPSFSEWFFAWVLPKDGLLQVGTADLVRTGVSVKKRFAGFVEYLKEEWGLEGRPVIREGTHIPYGSQFVHPGLDRVLLVGDAARLLDWGRGVGMDQAAKSGFEAARAVVEARQNGKSDAASLYREKALGVFRTAKAGYRLHGMFFKNPKGRRCLPRLWGAMDRMGAVRALTKAGWV